MLISQNSSLPLSSVNCSSSRYINTDISHLTCLPSLLTPPHLLSKLQFILMPEIETASMITMQKLVAPSMMVLEPTDHSYYMITDQYTSKTGEDKALWQTKPDDIVLFLDDVLEGRIKVVTPTPPPTTSNNLFSMMHIIVIILLIIIY